MLLCLVSNKDLAVIQRRILTRRDFAAGWTLLMLPVAFVVRLVQFQPRAR
jgi:hypothetical protein